jgi:betaine-homocysteine S-methyltransferase
MVGPDIGTAVGLDVGGTTMAAGVVDVPIAVQPAAFRTSEETPCFTRVPEFPDGLETIQIARSEFEAFGRAARTEGIGYVGGCCGCNAAYVRALKRGLEHQH